MSSLGVQPVVQDAEPLHTLGKTLDPLGLVAGAEPCARVALAEPRLLAGCDPQLVEETRAAQYAPRRRSTANGVLKMIDTSSQIDQFSR